MIRDVVDGTPPADDGNGELRMFEVGSQPPLHQRSR